MGLDSEVSDLFDENQLDTESPAKEQKTIDVTLPRHALSHTPQGDTYLMKMPVFLRLEAHPFDPAEFKESVEQSAAQRTKSSMDQKQIQNDAIAEKLLNQNTIRWRYSNVNNEIVKQLNAHFVEWDDGLLSLKVGNELFDFREVPLSDNFLARSHVEHEVLQNELLITKSASLLPTSTKTSTHRQLTQAVKSIQRKDKILNTLTEKDPMLKQRLADENERKVLKMKRQMEQKRRAQEERLGSSSKSYDDKYERAYGDEYDEEDGFVANDDEELEEEEDDDEEDRFEKGAERLAQVKSAGAEKYRSATPEVESRKRRRIIESDEE